MSKISYTVFGSDLQYVEIVLPPNTAVVGEQGAMMYMDDKLTVTTVLGDGSKSAFGVFGRFWKAFKRALTGESFFSGYYKNKSEVDQRVAFATASISKIVAIDLAEMGGELICQKGAYLAAEEGTEVKLAWQKRLRVGFFGGEGFIMQRISGNGVAFISANGGLTEMVLQPGQVLKVDSGCLVALSPSVSYEIKYAGKIKTAIFGGEGLFYAALTGPGKVWLQSLPERRLALALMRTAMMGRTRGLSGKMYLLLIIVFFIISIMAELAQQQ